MRQRYIIFKEAAANNLVIREYCVIDNNLQHTKSTERIQDNYALMYQEDYDGDTINAAIPKGLGALIATLRTANLFPIAPNAVRIAESVMAIYARPKTIQWICFATISSCLSTTVSKTYL